MFSIQPRGLSLLPPKLPSLVLPGSPLKLIASALLPVPVFEITPLLSISKVELPLKLTGSAIGSSSSPLTVPSRESTPIVGPPTPVIVPVFVIVFRLPSESLSKYTTPSLAAPVPSIKPAFVRVSASPSWKITPSKPCKIPVAVFVITTSSSLLSINITTSSSSPSLLMSVPEFVIIEPSLELSSNSMLSPEVTV